MTNNDFIFNGEDFIDCIKTPEDMELFKRLRELEPELSKPASQCFKAILEAVKIADKLKGLPERKIVFQNPPLN